VGLAAGFVDRQEDSGRAVVCKGNPARADIATEHGKPPWIDTLLNSVYDKSLHQYQQGDGSVVVPLIRDLTSRGS
jgi:hypothetical protein